MVPETDTNLGKLSGKDLKEKKTGRTHQKSVAIVWCFETINRRRRA